MLHAIERVPGRRMTGPHVVVFLRAGRRPAGFLNGLPGTAVKSAMTDQRVFQDRMFLLLVAVVSAAFAWVLWPIFGAVFWAVILGIVFAPLYRRLCAAMNDRRTTAALLT